MNVQEILFLIRDITAILTGLAFLVFVICIFKGGKMAVKTMPWALWAAIIFGLAATITHVIQLIITG